MRHLAVAAVVAAALATLSGEEIARWLIAGAPPAGPAEPGTRAAARSDRPLHEVVVPAAPDGHFFIEAVVSGTPVAFMIDTGATDVVLTMADAERLGFRRHQLDFSRRYSTANGIVRGAPVRLRELRIGQFSLFDLDAAVTDGMLGISLLGMGFLERLEGYAVSNGRLVLHW